MGESTRIFQARQHLNGDSLLGKFMPYDQRLALLYALRDEEGDAIAEVVMRAVNRIKATPVTYQTEGEASQDKVLHLHYFMGDVDAWIAERDVGEGGTEAKDAGEGDQIRAYGKITLFGGGWKEAEWGYVSIYELIQHGVELDLYWEPKTAKEVGDSICTEFVSIK